jgi:hypothetical protein
VDCAFGFSYLRPQLQGPVDALLGAAVDNGVIRQTGVGRDGGGGGYGAVLSELA